MRNFTKNLLRVAALTLLLGAFSSNARAAVTFQILGDNGDGLGDWAHGCGIDMTATGENEYSATVTFTAYREFKIIKSEEDGSWNWNNDNVYGRTSSDEITSLDILKGGEFEVTHTNGGNNFKLPAALARTYTIKINTSTMKVTITPTTPLPWKIKGSFYNSWELQDMTNNGDGTYSFELTASANDEFGFECCGQWFACDGGHSFSGISPDTQNLSTSGSNLKFATAGEWIVKINSSKLTVTAELAPGYSGYYYLVGAFNSWNTTNKPFTKISSNEWLVSVDNYTNSVSGQGSGFKVFANNAWLGYNNLNVGNSAVTISDDGGNDHNMSINTSGNLAFILNNSTSPMTLNVVAPSTLASILSSGTNGNVYSISDALAIAAITEDGSRAYLTDGSNWVALELGSFSSAVSSHKGGIKGGTIVGTLSNRDTKPTITLTSIDLSDAVTSPSYSIANLDLTSSTFTAPKPCQLVNVVGYPNGGKLYGWGHHNESTHYINLATDYLRTAPSFKTDAKTTLENVAIELGKAISASAPRRAPASDYSNVTGQLTSPTMNVVTAVEDVNASKTVAGVKYYNLMGVESNQPFDGVNIIVTRYTDGTSQAVKVVK